MIDIPLWALPIIFTVVALCIPTRIDPAIRIKKLQQRKILERK